MAEEAAVENLPVNRFFCHKCSREIARVLPDYTCPNCQCGFIEALENQPGYMDVVRNLEETDESDSEFDETQPLELLNEVLWGVERRRRGGGYRRSGRLSRFVRNVIPLENMISDIAMNLSGSWVGSNATIGVGNGRSPSGSVLLLGNPGDYAWGREGLDVIVTHLLNQMDTAGPPPLAKEKIAEIPVAAITKEQVACSLQCSVCWEDFKVEEPVRKLPCEHVYHANCIVPWLELHGTCPICRKTLTEESADESGSQGQDNPSNLIIGNINALLRAANESGSTTPSNFSSSANRSSSSSSSSRSGFDTYTDVDFD